MISRVTLSVVLASLFLLPGCFCVSWKKYEPRGPRTKEGTFENDFVARIEPTHSGFSVFIQNSGPPYTLYTEYERSQPYASYSIDQAEIEWADGHKETLATPSDDCRISAIKATGYQDRIVYRAELELPRTFDYLPDEGTEATLRLKVTVRDGAGGHSHQLKKEFRFEHQKECHPITGDALMGA